MTVAQEVSAGAALLELLALLAHNGQHAAWVIGGMLPPTQHIVLLASLTLSSAAAKSESQLLGHGSISATMLLPLCGSSTKQLTDKNTRAIKCLDV